MRRLIALVAAVAAVTLATNAVLATASREVFTKGDERVVPNAMVQATLKFAPGMITVRSGDSVTWTHDDATTAPHTVTIVAEFPEPTLEGIFGCGAPGQPCAEALAAHAVSGPVVEAGDPGLDTPGDSLLFFDDQSISATVSAPAGSRLLYLCAIHPWMQGEIDVR
jgi:plastocyanin